MPDVIGMDDLLRKLENLTLTTQKKGIASALRKAGKLISLRAAQLAPKGFGTLSREQMVSVQEQTATSALAKIGFSIRAFWGLFQELGTAHHREQPFLLPAFKEKEAEAVEVIADELKRVIEDNAR